MTKTMRILTFLLLMVVGAGQMWANTAEPSNIKRGTINGGSVAFYADEACTTSFNGDVEANATVYVKATADPGKTAIGVTFTVKKSISSDAMQAPGRRSAPEGPGITSDITVSAVTGKPGIYQFTMPADGNTNVSVDATFAAPQQQQVSYVDGNGESQTVNAYVLDETMLGLSTGFYVVPNGGVTFSHSLSIAADANLILKDGATMTAATLDGSGNLLTVYAQTAMTGKLTVTTYACGVILVPHFVAYSGDYATALVASGTVSGVNVTTINGKTLKPLAGNAFTKYVPQDKSGSYTMVLPALPNGASYTFTKTDASEVINTYSYDAQKNTLTYTTNSGTTGGTTATITVTATGATNNNDYSFTLNVTVSEYTTAYGWPEQTSIWLDADNELVWAEGGNTLNTALITVKKGSTTITDYTVKMGDTELTAGENLLTLEPGVYRINITGDDGKLDDWVEFKVIQLNENDAKLTMDIPLSYVLPGVVTEPNTTVYYDGNNVTSAENTKLWYRHEVGENYTSHLNDELYDNDTYSTRQTNHVDALSGNAFTIGTGDYTDMRISNVNGSAPLDGVSRIDTKCGQVILHREGEEIKQKLDLDDVPVSSGVDGGYVYYVGIDCPDLYLKGGEVYYKDETGEHLANQTNDNNEVVTYAITDGKDIFYAGGTAISQYGNFVSFGENYFNLEGTPGVLTCASRKTIGWECHCQKDANGDCVSCFSQNGDILTVCGETIHLGQYILVGPNFVVLGDKYLYDFMPPSEGSVGPDSRKINAVFDADSHILTVAGYAINVGDRPICWVDDVACIAQVYYPTMNYNIFYPCAYVKYRTGDCCYSVARKDYVTIPYSSALSIQCDSQYKVGDDINITFTVSGCEDEYGNTDGKGSTGDVIVYLNNVYKSTLIHAPYEYNPGDLAEGTYVLRVKQHGDETHRGAETTATFTVVRNDSEVTLTGKQNTAGAAFEDGSNIEYDPENPIVVNAVNDKAVSGTYWTWQISNTSDAGVVKIDHTVNKSGQNNKNSEDVYLNTVGLGTVKLWAGFSGNDLYNPAKETITFTVVPKNVTSPIIELADQSTIYYDGTAKKPAVNVYYAEGKEIPATQYTVTYDNNINASTTDCKAKIIVKSKTGALYTIDAEGEFYIQETAVTITELPTASIISDGKTLAASTITGGKAKAGELDVDGTFSWKDATIAPTVDDSNVTEYDVTFTPNSANFKTGECKVTLTVMPRAMLFATNSTNLWATFCGQNDYELPEGCTAYTISSISGSTVTLSEITAEEANTPAIIPAYTPLLIQRGANVTTPVTATFSAIGTAPASGYNAQTGLAWIGGTNFAFYGNATDVAITANAASCTTEGGFIHVGHDDTGIASYVLRNGKFILVDENQGLAAHRCVLNVSSNTGNAPALTISTSVTGITTTNYTNLTNSDDAWYSLDGRKLNGKPTQKGIYIYKGIKRVVK